MEGSRHKPLEVAYILAGAQNESMSEYHVSTGYIPETRTGFVAVEPLPKGEAMTELLASISQPPDNERTYAYRTPERGVEVMVTPVKLEEMYIFRAFIAGLITKRNNAVRVGRPIVGLEVGEHLLTDVPGSQEQE